MEKQTKESILGALPIKIIIIDVKLDYVELLFLRALGKMTASVLKYADRNISVLGAQKRRGGRHLSFKGCRWQGNLTGGANCCHIISHPIKDVNVRTQTADTCHISCIYGCTTILQIFT